MEFLYQFAFQLKQQSWVTLRESNLDPMKSGLTTLFTTKNVAKGDLIQMPNMYLNEFMTSSNWRDSFVQNCSTVCVNSR